MIHLEHITKRYGGVAVVDDVSFEVGAGRTLVLVGPSGCGKSTLLRIITGLVEPDDGVVTVGNKRLTKSTRAEIRNRLGYVIQDGGLFPHLSAERNIGVAARFQGFSPKETADRIRELSTLTHFPLDALRRYPAQLSGGQRQRVGLMRALMTSPDLLLLDEPLGALDPIIRHELQMELREIFRTLRTTVIFVTHDLHEADFFADEIVLLRQGRIEQRGRARELAEEPASPFVSRFVNAQRAREFGAVG